MPNPAEYGDSIADLYDELHPGAPEAPVAALAEAALPGQRALELGIGTGRLALPLAARGLDVHGVDASEAMVARLRGKPGGAAIPVTIGDFADVSAVPGAPFDLVFCAFNTFFALLTQEDQLRCIEGSAARLVPGGRFVLECFVPGLGRFDPPQAAIVSAISSDAVFLDASRHDGAKQRVSSRLIRLDGSAVRILPIEIRYAWPSELDLMARLAGLQLESRWAGWSKEPFGAGSGSHVTTWRKPR